MTTNNTMSRQPTAQDYASPTQFRFNIIKLPKVEYFCTKVNIPGISLGGTMSQATRFKDLPIPGDKLSYEPLSMTFLVDENLENFQEIHGWLVGLGFPRDHAEFRNLFPTSLTGLQYDQQQADVNYLTATVTFSYDIYDFATVGSSTSSVTTS